MLRMIRTAYRMWYVRTHYYPEQHPRSKYLWSLIAVMALWAMVMEMDYQDQLLMEQSNHEHTRAYKKALLDCMTASANGEHGGFYMVDSGKTFECKVKEL